MKLVHCIICATAMLVCISCKTPQLAACGDVSKTSDLPWLETIVQKGATWRGQQLLKIDKITYSHEDSNTTYVGFVVYYETICCDAPDEYIYNCEGEVITIYGGVAGCAGECHLQIHSRTNLYTAQ